MPIKQSELHSSLWKSCNMLRGGMDASQYKDHVLVLLFIKYGSDKAGGPVPRRYSFKGNLTDSDPCTTIYCRAAAGFGGRICQE